MRVYPIRGIQACGATANYTDSQQTLRRLRAVEPVAESYRKGSSIPAFQAGEASCPVRKQHDPAIAVLWNSGGETT